MDGVHVWWVRERKAQQMPTALDKPKNDHWFTVSG